jgi:hypothetical protein
MNSKIDVVDRAGVLAKIAMSPTGGVRVPTSEAIYALAIAMVALSDIMSAPGVARSDRVQILHRAIDIAVEATTPE